MSSTEEYLQSIREARQKGRRVQVDFAALPEGVDGRALAAEMAQGLPEDYTKEIQRAAGEGLKASLHYGELGPKKTALERAESGLGRAVEAAGDALGTAVPPEAAGAALDALASPSRAAQALKTAGVQLPGEAVAKASQAAAETVMPPINRAVAAADKAVMGEGPGAVLKEEGLKRLAHYMVGKSLDTLAPGKLERRVAGDVLGAVPDLTGSAGGVLRAAGFEGIGRVISDIAEDASAQMLPEDPAFVDKLLRGAGSMAAFFIPGVGIEMATARAATIAPTMARVMGATASNVLESMTEAGSVYNEVRRRGGSADEAYAAGLKTFSLNAPLIAFSNRIELGGRAIGLFGDRARSLADVLANAAPEGLQEFWQQVISNMAQKDPAFHGALEAGVIGLITAGGATAAEGALRGDMAERVRAKSMLRAIGEAGDQAAFDPTVKRAVAELAVTKAAAGGPDVLSRQPPSATMAAAVSDISKEVAETLVKGGMDEVDAASKAKALVEDVLDDAREVAAAPERFPVVEQPAPQPETPAPAPAAEPETPAPTPEEVAAAAQTEAEQWVEAAGMPPQEAVIARQELIDEAKELGQPVSVALEQEHDALEPEEGGDISFDEAEVPSSPAMMTAEQFTQRFPRLAPEVHERVLRQAVLSGEEYNREAIDKYPRLVEELQQLQAGESDEEPTPIMKFIRERGGINLDKVKSMGTMAGYGELKGQDMMGKGLLRRGGFFNSLDHAAEAAAEAGLIRERDPNQLLEAIVDENRKSVAAALPPRTLPPVRSTAAADRFVEAQRAKKNIVPARLGTGKEMTPQNILPRDLAERAGKSNAVEEVKSTNQYFSGPEQRYFVYNDETGKPIGALHVQLQGEGGSISNINVGVLPQHQRKGIATKLYDAAERAGLDLRSATGKEGYSEAGARFAFARYGDPAAPRPTAQVSKGATLDAISAWSTAVQTQTAKNLYGIGKQVTSGKMTQAIVDENRKSVAVREDHFKEGRFEKNVEKAIERSAEEAKIALGADPQGAIAAAAKAALKAAKQTGSYDPAGVVAALEKRGFVDYRGLTVTSAAQAAELAAAFRHPKVEQFQAIFVKDGQVVSHRVWTSGLFDAVSLPQDMHRAIAKEAMDLQADRVWLAHNHPSGVASPSNPDISVTQRFHQTLRGRLAGHIVTDHDTYSVVLPSGQVEMRKFSAAKPSFRPPLGEVRYPVDVASRLAKAVATGETFGAILVDSRGQVLSVNMFPVSEDPFAELFPAAQHHGATDIYLAMSMADYERTRGKTMPRQVIDVVVFDEKGEWVSRSPRLSYQIYDPLGGLSLNPEEAVPMQVQEEKAPYRRIDPRDLAQLMKERGVQEGSDVTTRVGFNAPGGRIVRGTKGKILAFDEQTQRFMVDFGEQLVMTDPLQLKETYLQSRRPKAVPVKQSIAETVGMTKDPALAALRDKFRNQEKGARAAAREVSRKVRAEVLESLRSKAEELTRKQMIKRATGLERNEDLAEMAKMYRAQQKGAQMARREFETEKREAVYNERWLAAEMAESREKIIDYVKTFVPKHRQGEFLVAVRDAKNMFSTVRAFMKADKVVEQEYKKGLARDIRHLVSRAISSSNVSLDYKAKIREAVGAIEFKEHRESTLERLKRTQEFVNRMEAAGEDVELPMDLVYELEILKRKPLSEVTETELELLKEGLEIYESLGRAKQRARHGLYSLRLDNLRARVLPALNKLERRPKAVKKPGSRESVRMALSNAITNALNFFQHLDMAITPMDVIFDVLDGKKGYAGQVFRDFKARIDAAFSRYLDDKDGIVLPIRQLVTELQLSDLNLERIGVYAYREQKNGRQYLIDMGMSSEEIDGIKLDEKEMKAYTAMREVLDALRPRFARRLEELYNEPLGVVENYFPVIADWNQMSDLEVYKKLGASVTELGRYRKTTEQGSKKKRVGGLKAIKTNALEVFERHVDDVAYFINVQEDISLLYDLARGDDFAEAAGDYGALIVRQWVDLVARKGGQEGAKRLRMLDVLRRNIGAAAMGFKVSSIVIQPTAFFDGAALLGGSRILDGIQRVVADEEHRKFLLENFPELRHRLGDDPAFLEVSYFKPLEKWQRRGFLALQKMDAFTAAGTLSAAYMAELEKRGLAYDPAKADPEAVAAATRMMRRTQGSQFFKDAPLALSRGGFTGWYSIDRALFQFQSFMLNRWSVIRHDVKALGFDEGNKPAAVQAMMYYGMATMAEVGIRASTRAALAALFIGAGAAVEKEFDLDELGEDFARQLLQAVPFVSQAVSVLTYGSHPVPVLDVMGKAFRAPADLGRAKSERQKLRAMTNLVEALASLSGVAGVSQVAQLVRLAGRNK